MNSTFTRAQDREFGKKNEDEVGVVLNRIFNEQMIFNGKWETLDWANKDKTIYAELKSRRISVSAYPTALIGLNKIDRCSDPNKRYIFFYKYIDGLYYIKYRKALFDTFERNMEYRRNYQSDTENQPSPVVYVPIHLLKPISNFKLHHISEIKSDISI